MNVIIADGPVADPTPCPCGPESTVGGDPEHHPEGGCPNPSAGGLLCAECRAVVWAVLSQAPNDFLSPANRLPVKVAGRPSAGPVDNSPEAKAARALAKARHAEALAYVATYSGRWGLPLDIRANPRWGSKHLKLTERQVDALLAGKARDAERAAAEQANRHPRYDEALTLLAEARPGEFINSLRDQVSRGRTLSERQVEALLRGANRGHVEATQAADVAAQRPAGQAVGGPVTEGYYLVAEQPWRAVVSKQNRLYAMRLDLDTGKWEYVAGGLRTVATGRPMTLDEAKAYGKLYGRCMVCGATLTDPESIAAGIGPICAGRWA